MLALGYGAAQRGPSGSAASARYHHRGVFRDRMEAGQRLADALKDGVSRDAVVLAIPRGGVIVAAPIAAALAVPLDVVIPRKLGAPMNPELAIGAVAPGVRVLDDRLVERLGVSSEYLEEEIRHQEEEIERRTDVYRDGRPPAELAGATAVVVDDGVATGATAVAALRWARGQTPARVVFAAPVGPVDTAARLALECDEVVILETPRAFFAVGEWYERFDQVTDEEVRAVLAASSG
jgi:putative phosphoribosyl transferase